jgi:hypothetical protein
MSENQAPVGVHLVGSAPVNTAEEMFRLSTEHLGSHLKRLPDGEVGERHTWIRWQHARIAASPQISESDREPVYVPRKPLGIVDGIESAEDIEFPGLGYANAAIYVSQIEDQRLEDALSSTEYLEATAKILHKHDGLWFNDESFVVSRRAI